MFFLVFCCFTWVGCFILFISVYFAFSCFYSFVAYHHHHHHHFRFSCLIVFHFSMCQILFVFCFSFHKNNVMVHEKNSSWIEQTNPHRTSGCWAYICISCWNILCTRQTFQFKHKLKTLAVCVINTIFINQKYTAIQFPFTHSLDVVGAILVLFFFGLTF